MKTAKFFAPVIASLTLVALSATAQVGTFQLKSLTRQSHQKYCHRPQLSNRHPRV